MDNQLYKEVTAVITISVCVGSACHIKGAHSIINDLQRIICDRRLENSITLKAAFCLGECTNAVSVKVDDGPVISVEKDGVEDFFNNIIEGGLEG
jgi:NADH:ubiquinone oxidoreductase subunit E